MWSENASVFRRIVLRVVTRGRLKRQLQLQLLHLQELQLQCCMLHVTCYMLRVTCYGPGLRLAAAVLVNSSIRFQLLHDGAPPRSESSDFVGDETHDGMWFCRSNALDALTPCVGHNTCADSLFASFASGRN